MRRVLLFSVVVLLGVCAPAAWAKGSFDSVFADYTKDGKIDPCKHSASDLQKARADIPPDIEQYAPDFPDALDAAIEARARGACAKKSKPASAPPAAAPPVTTTPAPPPSGGTPGKPAPAPAPASAAPPAPQATAAPAGAPTDQAIAKAASHDSGDSDVPAPLVGLGVLVALAIVCAVALALVRWRAWEPGWAQRARHATGEAGYRVSATWAEFADWLRLGQR